MKTIKAKITFIEPILGSLPNDPDLMRRFIEGKNPDPERIQEEIDAVCTPDGVENELERKTTVFAGSLEGKPYIIDYQVKGFFKEACRNVRKDTESASAKLKNFMKIIDGNVFVYAAGIRPSASANCEWKKLYISDPHPILTFERPLRASTPQGERIGLARSEIIDAGKTITLDIVTLVDEIEPLIREWLDYGIYKGLSQWRNAGYGRFVWDELNEDGEIIGGNNEFTK